MLRSLRVKNFAVIEEAELDFSTGFNVLTGETGAGKSILMEAVGFLMGGRGSSSWIRSGAKTLQIEATFDSGTWSHFLAPKTEKTGSLIHIRREIDEGGKSRAFINEEPVAAAVLSQIADSLIDFHGQNQHQKLMKPAFQREFLDSFAEEGDLLKEVKASFERWSFLKKKIESLSLSEAERNEKLDYLRFRLDELEAAHLEEGEEERLEAELPSLRNAERLKSAAFEAYGILYSSEASCLAQVQELDRQILELAKMDPSLERLKTSLSQARMALSEIADALSNYQSRLSVDPARLDSMLARLDQISRLKKKYGKDFAGLLIEKRTIAEEVFRLENREEGLGQLERQKAEAESELKRLCEKLHSARIKGAQKLERALSAEFKGLGLGHAELKISIEMEEGHYHAYGADEIEFMFAANPGTPLRPLRETASGGELSRVMLGLKTVLAQADKTPVLIFDEVDAGVGGAAARAIGEKLLNLAQGRQILCVTHLPQIASLAQTQFHVSKEMSAGAMKTRVKKLSGDGRLEVLAVMLGGSPTPASFRHARELLEESGNLSSSQGEQNKKAISLEKERVEKAGKK